MDWKQLLAYITGTVDQELLLRNEYLVTENRILRDQLKGRVRLRDGERKALVEIGQKVGKQALSSSVMASPRPRSARRPPRGRSSSGHIWTCWSRRTFSRPRSGRWVGS